MLLERLGEEPFDMDTERLLGFRIDDRIEIAIYRHTDRLPAAPEQVDQQGVAGAVVGDDN